MAYTVKQLGNLAHISVRTLHFYDETGLLKPAHIAKNGYRFYGEKELLRLQQILFFRELDFPLEEIKQIIDDPKFSIVEALKDHKKQIELKRKRLTGLLETIDKTIKKMSNKKDMKDEELYQDFDTEDMKKYQQEAKEKWGNTKAYKQSQERTKNWKKEDYARVKKESEDLMNEIVKVMPKGPTSPEMQELVQKWRDGINQFYDTNLEMCRNLATMYVEDARFTATYEKYHEGLAVFMRDAIYYYCDHQTK
jgi:DNA-binding transcriptional MerR regulator